MNRIDQLMHKNAFNETQHLFTYQVRNNGNWENRNRVKLSLFDKDHLEKLTTNIIPNHVNETC